MKIILICNENPPWPPKGGVGTFVQALAQGLTGRGHKVSVVGLGSPGEEYLDNGVPVVVLQRYNTKYIGNIMSRLRLRMWLTARFKAGQVDLIEAPEGMGYLPFGVRGCPVIIRLHLSSTVIRNTAGSKGGKGIAFYERHTLKANRDWIAVSNHILNMTQSTFGISPKKSAIIYNPIPQAGPLPELAGLPDNFVLYAGTVRRSKGALVLAEAARDLLIGRPDLHLVYAGGILQEEGHPTSERILALIGPSLAGRVHFLGHMKHDEVLACMTRARVFAFPSFIEGFPLVVLEAMGCGVPVVFSNIPPGPEMIEDDVTGLLADPASPPDVREKIARLLDDSTLATRLAANARRVVNERFSVGNCLDATERFYSECLNQ